MEFIFLFLSLEYNFWTLGETLHTSKMYFFGCAAVVMYLDHNLSLGRDNKMVSKLRLWFCRLYDHVWSLGFDRQVIVWGGKSIWIVGVLRIGFGYRFQGSYK